MDHKRFAANLMGLAEVLGSELSPLKMKFYSQALEKYSDDQIERAITVAASTLQFFPKPIELIELIEGKSQDKALLAWEQLLEAVKNHGSYASVVFGDGKIARAVELMGGWFQVCAMTEEETKWKMNDFTKIYQGLTGDSSPRKLIGRYEQDNHARGFGDRIGPPVLIGDCRGYKEEIGPPVDGKIVKLIEKMRM